MNTFDLQIFNAVYGLAHQSRALDIIGGFCASYLQYLLVALTLVFWFWPKDRRQTNRPMVAVGLTAAIIARLFVKTVIIFFYERARPYIVLTAVKPLITTSSGEALQSFPSGHAIFFFALATGVWFFNRKFGRWLFAAAILMGVARIFTGMHWPTDILGGAILGIVVGWVVYSAFKRLGLDLIFQRSHKAEIDLY